MAGSVARSLLFLLKDDQILLALKKRGHGQGYWNGVGGKVESGETIEDCLVRETQEEISVTPLEYKKAAELTFITSGSLADNHVHVFICKSWSGEPSESEEMKPRWFKRTDIPSEQMWPEDKVWLPLILSGQKIKATFYFGKDGELRRTNLEIVDELL